MQLTSYHLNHPKRRSTSVIFASPHSGNAYPWSFLRKTVLDEKTIRSSEDAFVDQLFDSVPSNGALFLKAGVPRAFVDLNRAEDELDPALIEGIPRKHVSPRVAMGLGVVPRVVANSRSIYYGKISLAEAEGRLKEYWQPYHDTLHRLMRENTALFGQSILIDCHSMPREAVAQLSKTKSGRPDIVIGDRFGASAAPEIVEKIEALFAQEGLNVARNAPFAGAYTVRRYGKPARGRHAVQIEIDRSLYMDEMAIEPNRHFDEFKDLIQRVTAQIADIGRTETTALAAE